MGVDDPASSNGEVYDNYVDIRERPNPEYGTDLQATAFRMRPWNDMTNIDIHDNTFIARTDATGACRIRRRDFIPGGQYRPRPEQSHYRQLFKAIVNTTDTNYYAIGLVVRGLLGPTDSPHFVGNTVESNDTSLAFSATTDGIDVIEWGLCFHHDAQVERRRARVRTSQ